MSTFSELIDFTRSSTGTYLGSDGLIKTANVDEPRLEYDASGQPLGLLIEEQRTNLVSNSSFSSAWSGGGYIKTANATIAPDGTNTATKIAWDNTTSYHSIFNTYSVSAQTSYTRSVYAKASELSWIYVQHYDSGGGANNNGGVYFDVANGVKGTESSGHTGTIEDIGNGWYRCSVAYTTSTGTTTERLQVALTTGDNVLPNNLTGDGVSGVFLWGAQLEQGSFPTSYIPTSGSTVTRNKDVCRIEKEEYHLHQKKGTIYCEFDAITSTAETILEYQRIYELATTDSDDRVAAWIKNDNGSLTSQVADNNVIQATQVLEQGYNGKLNTIKLATTYGVDYFQASNDGKVSSIDTSVALDYPRHRLGIMQRVTSGSVLCGHMKRITYTPKVLTEAQLIDLTKPSSSPTMSLTFDGQATSELVEGLHD